MTFPSSLACQQVAASEAQGERLSKASRMTFVSKSTRFIGISPYDAHPAIARLLRLWEAAHRSPAIRMPCSMFAGEVSLAQFAKRAFPKHPGPRRSAASPTTVARYSRLHGSSPFPFDSSSSFTSPEKIKPSSKLHPAHSPSRPCCLSSRSAAARCECSCRGDRLCRSARRVSSFPRTL
jgi:hypothetical protein